ncbi:unnamed protein product [Pedinophyceae sp. YPF-701]|nr:unnamed protein product [Pedinophyceae sp. YPF-701]
MSAPGQTEMTQSGPDTDLTLRHYCSEPPRLGPSTLTADVYSKMVQMLPIVCVDCVLQRADGKFLLVERVQEPAKGFWWLPGGRLLKNESFFEGAVRKLKQETGIECTPAKLLAVYNAMYPRSAWDTEDYVGTHTVNAVVLMPVSQEVELKLDAQAKAHVWEPADWKYLEEKGYDTYVVRAIKSLNEGSFSV